MRFGIMNMQMDALIPPGFSPQNAQAHIAGFDHPTLVRQMAAPGFNLIELGGDLTLFFPQAYAPQTVERLAALKAELGLSYTVHLPLWSVEPSTPLTPVRQGSARSVIEVIQATAALAPEAYVLHATGPLAAEFYRMKLPAAARELILRHYFQRASLDSLRAILGETGLPSRRLAIETIEFPLELTLEMAEALDLAICLDTGHILSGFSGPVDFFDALERCLPRLAEIHLHDSPRNLDQERIVYGQDHRQLGTGDLELGRLLDRLVEAGFRGPIIFELNIPQALASLAAIRAVRPGLL
jgi:sugar phosphate isomerase/epimerase